MKWFYFGGNYLIKDHFTSAFSKSVSSQDTAIADFHVMNEKARLLSKYVIPVLAAIVLLQFFPVFFVSIDHNVRLNKFLLGLPPEADFHSRWLPGRRSWENLPIDTLPESGKRVVMDLGISLPLEGAIRFEFAETAAGVISLEVEADPTHDTRTAVVREGERSIVNFPVAGKRLPFSAGIYIDSLSISTGDSMFSAALSEPVNNLLCSLFNDSGTNLLVEKLEIDGMDLRRNLPEPGVVLSLPRLFGLENNPSRSIPAGIAALALACLLIDLALSPLLRRFSGRHTSETEGRFLFMPLRLLLLFAAGKAFGLPVSAFFYLALWLVLVETSTVFPRAGGYSSTRSRTRLNPHLAAVIPLYIVAAAPASVILVREHGFHPAGAAVAATFPLLVVLFSALPTGGDGRSIRLFLAALAQLPVFFAGPLKYCPFLEYPVFLLLLFLPWAFLEIATIILGRSPRTRSLPLARVLLAAALFPIFLETCLATSEYTNNSFAFGSRDPWSYERYTNILGQFDSADRLMSVEWVKGYGGGVIPLLPPGSGSSFPRGENAATAAAAPIYSKQKPENRFRIVCLGSSSTAGVGATSLENTYPGQLERILGERMNMDLEVISGGLPGATFCVLSVYLEDVLFMLHPDLVIVYFGHNGDEPGLREHWERLKSITPEVENFRDLRLRAQFRTNNRLLLDLLDILVSFRSFNALLEATDFLSNELTFDLPGSARGPEPKGPGMVRLEPDRIARLCIGKGVAAVFMPEILTTAIEKSAPVHMYHELFAETANRYNDQNIRYLDLVDAFRDRMVPLHGNRSGFRIPENGNGESLPTKDYFLDAMHMYDAGYLILAELTAEYLLEEEIVPAKRPPP